MAILFEFLSTATLSNMGKYCFPNECLPPRLFRIDHPGSRKRYSASESFVANDMTKTYAAHEEAEFKRDIEKQFD